MQIFVTGGAGYVGSHCVRGMTAAGHAVTVFDNLVAGHRGAIDPKARFVQGELADAGLLKKLFAETSYDAVMHFAAWLNVGESVHKPLEYFRNNVSNTLTLLESMRDAAIRRFVFSSTCAIYGEPAALPIVEALPTNPINPYGETKLAVEWMLRDCAPAWGLGSVALRYFNASGAAPDATIGEDHHPENHLIPLVLQVALGQREFISVFGNDYPTPDGTCVRDYIHVEDLADAHLRAVAAVEPGRPDAFNVGTGQGHSVQEVIAAARRVTGHAIPVRMVERRAGDPPSLYANSDKLRKSLGWSPKWTELDRVIGSAWEWHRTHPRGYDDR